MILLNKNNLFFGFTLDLDFEDKKQKLYGFSKIILLKEKLFEKEEAFFTSFLHFKFILINNYIK